MARKGAAKTTRINREDSAAVADIERYCRGLNDWPRSWMGLDEDLPPGEQLVACFRPFLEHLASSGMTRKTIQHHVDNMWALGGEFITQLNYYPELKQKPVLRLLREMIRSGGPLLRRANEDEQASFDSTCRMFSQFLKETAR